MSKKLSQTIAEKNSINYTLLTEKNLEKKTPQKFRVYSIYNYMTAKKKFIENGYKEYTYEELLDLLVEDNAYHCRVNPANKYKIYSDVDNYAKGIDAYIDLWITFLKEKYNFIITKDDFAYTENQKKVGYYRLVIPKYHAECAKIKEMHDNFRKTYPEEFDNKETKKNVVDIGVYGEKWLRYPNQIKGTSKNASAKDVINSQHQIIKGSIGDFIIEYIEGTKSVDHLQYLGVNKKHAIKIIRNAKIEQNIVSSELSNLCALVTAAYWTPYESWIKLGQIIFNEGGGLDLWKLYSKETVFWNEAECVEKWNLFHNNGANEIKIGTMISEYIDPEIYQAYCVKRCTREYVPISLDIGCDHIIINEQYIEINKQIVPIEYKLNGVMVKNNGTIFDLTKYDTIIESSTTGTGKSQSVAGMKHDKLLFLGSRCSLVSDVVKKFRDHGLDMHDYRGVIKDDEWFYDGDINDHDMLGIQADSTIVLTNKNWKKIDIFIDEVDSYIPYLIDSDTLESKRKQVFEKNVEMVKNCKKLIVSDADISDSTLTFIKGTRDVTKTILIENIYKKQNVRRAYHMRNEYDIKDKLLKCIDDPETKGLTVTFDSLARQQIIFSDVKQTKEYKRCPERFLVYSSEEHAKIVKDAVDVVNGENIKTKGRNKKSILNAKNGKLPEVRPNDWKKNEVEKEIVKRNDWEGKFVFYTPTIIYGVDFTPLASQDVFSYIDGRSLNCLQILQQVDRNRNIRNLYFFTAKYVHNMHPLKYQSIDDVRKTYEGKIKNFKQYIDPEVPDNDTKRIGSNLNKIVKAGTIIRENGENILTEDLFNKLIYINDYKEDTLRSNYFYHLIEQLKLRGFEIHTVGETVYMSDNDKNEAKDFATDESKIAIDNWIKGIHDSEFRLPNKFIESLEKVMGTLHIDKTILSDHRYIADKHERSNYYGLLKLVAVNSKIIKDFKDNFDNNYLISMLTNQSIVVELANNMANILGIKQLMINHKNDCGRFDEEIKISKSIMNQYYSLISRIGKKEKPIKKMLYREFYKMYIRIIRHIAGENIIISKRVDKRTKIKNKWVTKSTIEYNLNLSYLIERMELRKKLVPYLENVLPHIKELCNVKQIEKFGDGFMIINEDD